MSKAKHPRRGSMQYWPRKRSKRAIIRVRSWAPLNTTKPLGFVTYKAGMTHLQVIDNRPKALTKDEKIALASTILDCPPMMVLGAAFYKKAGQGVRKFTSILAEKQVKELSKKIQLPKKTTKKLADVTEFDDVRLLVHSQPKLAANGAKKPALVEVPLGGSNEDKLAYVKEHLGKEITINDVFESGNSVDAHGISKGKGYQGTVKRYGVPIRQHKSEKTKRGIGNLGAWTPKRVDYRVPQPGKMGFHARTEYNKRILKIGDNVADVTPRGGFKHYGLLKNPYVLLKGSIVGSTRRAVLLTHSIRPHRKMVKEAPEIKHISLRR
jgi:large subunit ribosomal protein L3